MRDRILDVINLEIGFHSDVINPWLWRWICKIFKKRECHEVLVNELKYLKAHIERMPVRTCADCGESYSPIDATDWWCKDCLTKRYNDCRKFGIDYRTVEPIEQTEPRMTDSGPGGS